MMQPKDEGVRHLVRILGDFRILLVLFVTFRFVMLLAYPPFLIDGSERGIGTGGDRVYHYELSSLADEDLLPFRDWWSEFPPVWYLVTTGIYLLLGPGASYHNWSLLLGMLVILSEVGNLVLMRLIGDRLHGSGAGMALAWVYALLAAPAVYMWWNFDTLVTLSLLLGIWLLLTRRFLASALVVAAGALTKFVPLLIFGVVVRFYRPGRALRYVAAAALACVLVYLPLFAVNAENTLVSLTAQFSKPSYQTVWAIIDGNYTTGNFGSIRSHLDPQGVDEVMRDRNPAAVPSWLRLGLAGLIGLFVFLRTRRFDEIGLVAFVGITLLIFYLQSQGFSPQWLSQILPLVLLVFPNRDGVIVLVLLTLLAFVEYPFIFVRMGDTGGVISGPLFMPWVLIVAIRTLILVGICVAFYRKLRGEPIPEQRVQV